MNGIKGLTTVDRESFCKRYQVLSVSANVSPSFPVTVQWDSIHGTVPLLLPCSNLLPVSFILGSIFPCQLTLSYKLLLFSKTFINHK